MLHIENARTRMPLFCSVISLLVLGIFLALGCVSCLLEGQNAPSEPQLNGTVHNGMSAEGNDAYAVEPWVKSAREF